jgi:hypothetical protein
MRRSLCSYLALLSLSVSGFACSGNRNDEINHALGSEERDGGDAASELPSLDDEDALPDGGEALDDVGTALDAGAPLDAAAQVREASASEAGSDTREPCRVQRFYRHETDNVGTARLELTESDAGVYVVREVGLDNFDGTGVMQGHTLRVDFHTIHGYVGVYTWLLDDDCLHGEGMLVFSAGDTGTRRSQLFVEDAGPDAGR